MTFILDALRWIGILLLVLMLFNLVIVVHEYGHFIAARWRGLKVEKFQIWFGKPIWKKTVNGVQYGLGTIPFGGFVALPQMAPMEAIEGKSACNDDGSPKEVLPPIKPIDKIIVAFAGPLFSFLLAVTFAFIVWGVGKPEMASETEAVIGYIKPGSPAEKSGLQLEDIVTAVDGKPVKRFAGPVDSVMWGIVSAEKDDIKFSIIRKGQPMEIAVSAPTKTDPEFVKWEEMPWYKKITARPPMRRVGIWYPTRNMAVKELYKNGPAELAGVKPGDILRKINGKTILDPQEIGSAIKANPTAPCKLEVEREGKPVELTITPQKPDKPKDYKGDGEIGIMSIEDLDKSARQKSGADIVHPTPYTQISESLHTTFATLGALVSKDSSVQAGHMSSAIGIISIYHQLFSIENGWRLILWFTVVLNINLAILNMLPLPVLDGGHITMAVIEGVRRKPLRGKILEYVQAGFAIMLLSFMFWVMLKDVGGFFGEKSEPIEFSAPASTPAK